MITMAMGGMLTMVMMVMISYKSLMIFKSCQNEIMLMEKIILVEYLSYAKCDISQLLFCSAFDTW